MISPTIWIIALVAVFFLIIAAVLLFAPGEKSHPAGETMQSVITAPENSVVTVRKVGMITHVDIRSNIHNHWEGEGGVETKPTPVEITRRDCPELYEEYLSSETTATRKYEIVDELYSMGYTLPLIPSLHEQWVLEQQMTRLAHEDPPEEDPAPNRLKVNRDLEAGLLPPAEEPGEEDSYLQDDYITEIETEEDY